ncbi:MAG: hypothetical protein JW884_01265 [Deltaproteobacteria bacterium]|nr:hypothetical protein [Deltaproteobacteria bacterium]
MRNFMQETAARDRDRQWDVAVKISARKSRSIFIIRLGTVRMEWSGEKRSFVFNRTWG